MSVHQGSGLPHGFVPSYLPGAASLVEELDQRLLIVLRDGRHLVGVRIFSLYMIYDRCGTGDPLLVC